MGRWNFSLTILDGISRQLLSRIALLAGLVLLGSCQSAPPKEALPALPVESDWMQLPAAAKFGEVSAVDVDDRGHIFVLHRAGRTWEEPFPDEPIAEPTVFEFSPDGRLLASWGAGQFIMPHGISIDPNGKIWITDPGREQVFRFSREGKQELVLGQRGVSKQDDRHFGRPADVAFLEDRVLVADGYTNTRIAEYDQKGRFLRDWGDFRVAHAVAVDGKHIFVADRENSRIQQFSHDGTLLASFGTMAGNHTYGLKPLANGRLLAVEGRDAADRTGAILRVYSPAGAVEASYDIGLPGEGASLGHDLAIGPDGMIYVTDIAGGRVMRFRLPKAKKGQ